MTVTEKYINPFTDFGFKKLFGTEPNKDLLIDFLNEVILPSERRIVDLTYKKNDQPGATEFDRKAIFDLYCLKWLYVLKNLATLPHPPSKLQEKIFQRLFETAEIAKFSPQEKEQYEESLKSYRDLKNVIDTSFSEGKIEGKIEEKTEGIISAIKRGKLTFEEIAEDFKTTVEFVLKVKKDYNL